MPNVADHDERMFNATPNDFRMTRNYSTYGADERAYLRGDMYSEGPYIRDDFNMGYGGSDMYGPSLSGNYGPY